MATDATKTLNDLIEICIDGKYGYEQAAENAGDATLKSLFLQYGAKRGEYANELRSLVTASGGTPADSGSAVAGLHRTWIGLKDKLTSGDGGILAECVRGEESADKTYEKALADADLPANAKPVVSRQHDDVEQALSHMKSLTAQYA